MRVLSIGWLLVAAGIAATNAAAAELAYMRVPAGEPVPLYATAPEAAGALPASAMTIPPGALISLDAALLDGDWANVVALVMSQGVARPVSGFVALDRLERVEPRGSPNGLPWAGDCHSEAPYRGLLWQGSYGNLTIDVPYDHAMSVVVPYPLTPPPVLAGYRGAVARPEYQFVLSMDPARLCTMVKGPTGIEGTLAIQVDGGGWSTSGVCCAATMAAF